jgi:hypothetical protein
MCERTISTERPPFVGEVSANFCRYRVPRGQRDGSLRPHSRFYRPDEIVKNKILSEQRPSLKALDCSSYNFALELAYRNLYRINGRKWIKFMKAILSYISVTFHRFIVATWRCRERFHFMIPFTKLLILLARSVGPLLHVETSLLANYNEFIWSCETSIA